MADPLIPTYRFGEKAVIGNVDFLRSEIEPLFKSAESRVIFDVQNLRICDVYGIQLFLDCKRHADEAGKRLILFKPGASFREILEQAGFSDWFEMRSGE